MGSCSLASPELRPFLASECVPNLVDHTRGSRVRGQIFMNGQVSHESHHLCVKDDVFYCETCGLFAHKRLVKLKAPCVGLRARTAHGDRTLESVEKGFRPSFYESVEQEGFQKPDCMMQLPLPAKEFPLGMRPLL